MATGAVPAAERPALEVRDLVAGLARSRRQGETVALVDGVSLRVERGQAVGLVGESGCGKSMTALSALRLLPPGVQILSGQVLVGGRDLVALDEAAMRQVRGREVAAVFQDPMTSLTPTMTVGRQVAEAVKASPGARGAPRRARRAPARARALEVLALVGLPRPEERMAAYPHQLSGGQRQRVLIAQALVGGAPLLLADEPTTALDATVQAQILELLDDLRVRLGTALLLITHDMGVIAGRTDRVAVMYAGRVVEEAQTAELFAAPHHPYTEALLASLPRPGQGRDEPLATIPGRPPEAGSWPSGCRFAPRCRYATDVCEAVQPPLADQLAAGHPFACHHPVNTGATASLPPPAPVVLRDRPPPPPPVVCRDRPPPPAPVVCRDRPPPPAPVVCRDRPPVLATPGPDGGGPVLEVDRLVKEFPVGGRLWGGSPGSVKAVSDVSFALARGETFGLVGESGSGKTTLARMVVALEVPTSGDVRVNGTSLASMAPGALRRARRSIQPVFQDSLASLDPRSTIVDSVGEPLVVQAIGARRRRRGQVDRLLDEVGLSPDMAARRPHELSGGQRQRVGLARALALRPDLIVADEPVSALDVSIRAQILNLMIDLQSRYRLTYLFISHDLAVVRYVADRIGVMYMGKLVEVGPAAAVYDRPAHPYTAGLIRAVPALPAPPAPAPPAPPPPAPAPPAPAPPAPAPPGPAPPGPARPVPGEPASGAPPGEMPSALQPPSGCRFRTRCPRAAGRCAEEEPALATAGPGHLVACHFPEERPGGQPASPLRWA
ncbi:MAG: dipeptide ABC transporter ATP-binding protein [Acidimicrobiales bacterium]